MTTHFYGYSGRFTSFDVNQPQPILADPEVIRDHHERATAESQSRHAETMDILRRSLANRQPAPFRTPRNSPYR